MLTDPGSRAATIRRRRPRRSRSSRSTPAPTSSPWAATTPSGEDFSVTDPSGEGGPLEDVHFDYDQADARATRRARSLEKHALWLQNHRAARVSVEGHCDERGTVDYNLALGDKRARAARDYLVSLGVAADRLAHGLLRQGASARHGPARSSRSPKNRRAHFVGAPRVTARERGARFI